MFKLSGSLILNVFLPFIEGIFEGIGHAIGKWIGENLLNKYLLLIYKEWFRTYQFVAWKIDGKLAGTSSQILINLTRDTNMLAIYKRRILAPFWTAYYKFKIKTQSVWTEIVILETKLWKVHMPISRDMFF